MDQRAGASGPFVLPATVQRNWDGLANLRLQALHAGHPPGNYSVLATFSVTLPSAAGLVNRTAEWSDGGEAQLFQDPTTGNFGLDGPNFNEPIVLHSDGTAAIEVEFLPGGVVPPALAVVSVSAMQQSRG